MAHSWEGRHKLEVNMQLHALRLIVSILILWWSGVVREEKLDGIVMFADDSNMHSMELFDEIENVKWFGSISLGILSLTDNLDESSLAMIEKEKGEENSPMPVKGPACTLSNKLVGWHTFNSLHMCRRVQFSLMTGQQCCQGCWNGLGLC